MLESRQRTFFFFNLNYEEFSKLPFWLTPRGCCHTLAFAVPGLQGRLVVPRGLPVGGPGLRASAGFLICGQPTAGMPVALVSCALTLGYLHSIIFLCAKNCVSSGSGDRPGEQRLFFYLMNEWSLGVSQTSRCRKACIPLGTSKA